MEMKVGAATLLMSVMTIDRAFAGYTNITLPPVPEFDGSSSVAAIALLASVAAILLQKTRSS